MHMHDGMSMGDGMDADGAYMFQITNKKIAKLFWYFVAAVVAVCVLKRCCDALRVLYAKRKCKSRNDIPSRPTNCVTQFYDTTIAMSRELTYPQFRPLPGVFSRYIKVLPLGQTLLLLAYWIMILIMLWSNVILKPTSSIYGYKWEIVGFRAAWVSVTQLPLIYCLGGKANVISLVTGISYERLNWLHRWAARTIFLTVIVHWSYFFREWWLADFVQKEFKMMPMVKYGFGAWAVIGWSVITGFPYFRVKSYELWLLQHLASVGLLLWLLYVHVPSYARYNIWLSIGFVAFDRITRGLWSLMRNLHVAGLWQKVVRNQSLVGFDAEVESHGDGYLSLTIKHADFSWRAGQHVFISMPTCGVFESHPFTIANSFCNNRANDLHLYLKCHSGFTGRLRKRAKLGKADSIRTFVSGPWGNPPTAKIEMCNSLIFVASSTGAAFTVPLLEDAIKNAEFVQRISFYWIIRHESQLNMFMPRIIAALEAARQLDIETQCRIYITNMSSNFSPGQWNNSKRAGTPQNIQHHYSISNGSSREVASSDGILLEKDETTSQVNKRATVTACLVSSTSHTPSVDSDSIPEKNSVGAIFCQGRPQSWDALLHPTIVEAEGETVIVACGGGSLMTDIRNYVAWISDQRAVHKGTGAQGIYLFTETYGW